jgi:hypothetical protein
MQSHKSRNAASTLSKISPPVSDEDSLELDYLKGDDTGDGIRLYQLAQFSYITKSFTFGAFSSNGTDNYDRGTQKCLLLVHETRSIENEGSFSENTITRYLEFSLHEDMTLFLVGFKDGKEGGKYSGFN